MFVDGVVVVFQVVVFSGEGSYAFTIEGFTILGSPSFAPIEPSRTVLVDYEQYPNDYYFYGCRAASYSVSGAYF